MDNAPLYASANALQRRDAELIMKEFSSSLSWGRRPSEVVLDVGCGSGEVTTGTLANTLSSHMSKGTALEVLGVDKCVNMVEHAKQAYKDKMIKSDNLNNKNLNKLDGPRRSNSIRHNLNNLANSLNSSNSYTNLNKQTTNNVSPTTNTSNNNINFVTMDISQEIPHTKITRKFSKIFSFYCLHWVKDQRTALQNLHRLLDSDGEMFLIFLAKNPLFEVYRRLAEYEEWAPYMEDVEDFVPYHQDMSDPAETFRKQLEEAGFEVKHCEARNLSYAFENVNQLVAAVKAVNPFLKRIPAEVQSLYVRDLLYELGRYKNPTGKHEAKYTLMISLAANKVADNTGNFDIK